MDNNSPTSETLTPENPSVPAWIIIILLIFFAPVAWYFMWKDHRYHTWFPIVLIITAALMFSLLGVQTLIVMPKLLALYENLHVTQPQSSLYLGYGGIIYALCQAIFGIYLFRRLKSPSPLTKPLLIISVGFLTLNFLSFYSATPLIILSTIFPIYNLTGSL